MLCCECYSSSFVADSAGVKRNVRELLSSVSLCLQRHGLIQSYVPLDFYATGGVRKLPISEQRFLFDAIDDSSTPFRLKKKSVLAGTLGILFLCR